MSHEHDFKPMVSDEGKLHTVCRCGALEDDYAAKAHEIIPLNMQRKPLDESTISGTVRLTTHDPKPPDSQQRR